MSTGLECVFEEIAPHVWYYVLEHWDAPKQCWDWREYATAYGPFRSEDAAHAHLARHHSNPGGYSVNHREGHALDAVLTTLIEAAVPPLDRR
jgi:hypothetical protein